MAIFKDMPTGLKLTLSILLTSVVVMLLMCAAFFAYEYLTLRRTTVRQLATVGEIIASNSTAALAFDNRDDAKENLAALKSERRIVAACLYDRAGRLFAKYPDDRPADSFPPAPGPDGYSFDPSTLVGFQPVVEKGQRLGTLYFEFDTGSVIREWLGASATVAGGILAFVFIVAYALSRLLEREISRPILELADTARAVAERGDFSVRAVKSGNDELGLLTDVFNRMLAQIQILNRDLERRVAERTAELEIANRELEATNQELEAFTYSVAHDLRAPLRHIDGFAGLLTKHAGDSLDDKSRRYLYTISEAAKRMGQLIDDLLDFSRINRSQLKLGEVDHDALVASVIRDGGFDTTGRTIEWSIGPLPRVMADQAMLRQVWANLIGNAVKYSGKNARPRIAIGSVAPAGGNGELVFCVSDNGVGFDMAYADKLFGVFQRLHKADDFEGTGIGLANVHRIILRHKGRTWAEGRVGEGATFYFSLPANPDPSS